MRSAAHVGLLALLALPGVARATETVTVIEPEGVGPGTTPLAAELGAAIDQALARSSALERVSQTALLPGELRAAFNCLALDAECAGRAAYAAGAALAVFGRVERRAHTLTVRLYLVEAPTGVERRAHARRIQQPDREALDDARLRRIFRGLATHLLEGRGGGEASLYLVGAAGEIDGRAVPAGTVIDVPPGPHRVRIGASRVTLNPAQGELLIFDAGRIPARHTAPGAAEGARIGAWMALGVGVTTALGAAWVSRGYRAAERAYARAESGAELRESRSRAENQGTITNVLMATSVVAFGVSTWLFLRDTKEQE